MEVSKDSGPFPVTQRRYELDALRAFALILGVLLHASLAYIEPRIWIIKDTAHEDGLAILFYVIHMLRMTTFFVLAGFFARHLLKRKTISGFVKNRLFHVGLPLVIFWPLAIVSIMAMLIIGNMPAPGDVVTPPPPQPALTVNNFPLTHLWFLYLLLLFYSATIIMIGLTRLLGLGNMLGRLMDGVVVGLTRLDLIAALLIIPAGIALYFANDWVMWFGIPTPDYGLMPHLATLCAYFSAYGFGWWLHRHSELLDHLAKRGWVYLLAALIGTYFCLRIAGPIPVLTPTQGHAHPLYIALYLLSSWSWVLALIGLARRYLNFENKGLRFVADSAYWIYLVHLPLVLVFQHLYRPFDWPAEAKLPAVVFSTLACALVTYQLLVRYSFIGTILNGKRTPKARV